MSTSRVVPVLLIGVLLLVRLPSLAQPMGPDQGLYAYVGERILRGELAYRDAWDQKPPGIHYVYAALRAISSRDAAVPAADLAAAAGVALLLWRIGTQLNGPVAGAISAVLFLLLSDPYLARYGGVRVRAQAETFIALAVTAALALVAKRAKSGKGASGAEGAKGAAGAGAKRAVGAGVLVGTAFALKYNAGLYGLVVLLAVYAGSKEPAYNEPADNEPADNESADNEPSDNEAASSKPADRWRDGALVVLGAMIVPLLLLVRFWLGGALDDLYQATIVYNMQYAYETYASRWQVLRYVFVAPIRHAQVDPLWFVGGAGCLTLLFFLRQRRVWIPLVWVGVACVSIAINGARDLPQYFVQAAPALALAAGMAGALTLPRLPVAARWVVVLILAAATWQVGTDPFPKLAGNVRHDLQYLTGKIDRRTHLAKYGSRDIDKYSALGNRDVGDFLGAHTRPEETVYVFGFSPGAYVYANRRSASRFFWSRPVVVGFNQNMPSYGVNGVRSELERRPPAYVVMQQHDWGAAEATFRAAERIQDSAAFFHSQPALDTWLRANYHPLDGFVDGFEGWERNGRRTSEASEPGERSGASGVPASERAAGTGGAKPRGKK